MGSTYGARLFFIKGFPSLGSTDFSSTIDSKF